MNRHTSREGLTLLELLVVLGVTGVLAGIASFSFDRDAAELTRAAADVRARVLASRYEAIKRNRAVYITFTESEVVFTRDDPPNGTPDQTDPTFARIDRAEYRGLTSFATDAPGDAFGWTPEGLPRSAAQPQALGADVVITLTDRSARERCLRLEPGGRLTPGSVCPGPKGPVE
jgi:prepilin-type N-terminal cleavage/methylation domain-containing protein